VEVSDFSKIRRDVIIRSQWEGNPDLCMKRDDIVGVVSELSPVTPPSFAGPLVIVEE